MRLPFAVKDLFSDWLSAHYPDRREKVLNRIRSMRDGKLNDSNFNTRMAGKGIFADQFSKMFEVARRKAGIDRPFVALSNAAFRRPLRAGDQMALF